MCHGHQLTQDELYVEIRSINKECEHPLYKYPIEVGSFASLNSEQVV